MKSLLTLALWLVCTSPLFALDPDTSTLRDGSAMGLFGIGLYQDLNADVYVGAIYLEPEAVAIEKGRARKMSMRVLMDALSARKFTRQWLDAIAVNSSRDERERDAGQIRKFGEAYQNNLIKGDQVSFEYSPRGDKTVLLLNDVVLAELAGENLYNILENCWIGNAPLSATFKAGVTRQQDSAALLEHKTRYAALRYSQYRQDAVKAALGTALDAAKLEQERLVSEEQQQRHAVAEAERQAALQLQRERQAEADRVAQQQARAFAEQERLRARYSALVSSWINQNSIYPERAERNRLEGDLALSIKSNRRGKIVGITVDTSSGISELDKAVATMVSARADPLPEMPAKLDGDTFEFVMPFSFALPH